MSSKSQYGEHSHMQSEDYKLVSFKLQFPSFYLTNGLLQLPGCQLSLKPSPHAPHKLVTTTVASIMQGIFLKITATICHILVSKTSILPMIPLYKVFTGHERNAPFSCVAMSKCHQTCTCSLYLAYCFSIQL